jgi:predicted DCC family thiol-disulfide oxidoreductase YuxK
MENKSILLFDGVCNLCNRSVQFIIKRDQKKQFLFAPLQGKTGQDLLQRFNLPANNFNSFVLVEKDKVYTRSSAALRVSKTLGRGWQFFYVFMIVPRFIRDGVYNLIAKNRYKWFGKKNSCLIPTPELKDRFLD